jgi:hypothetical protein
LTNCQEKNLGRSFCSQNYTKHIQNAVQISPCTFGSN